MTPASQGSLTQNCHKDPKQNSHIIIFLWELVRLPLPFSISRSFYQVQVPNYQLHIHSKVR